MPIPAVFLGVYFRSTRCVRLQLRMWQRPSRCCAWKHDGWKALLAWQAGASLRSTSGSQEASLHGVERIQRARIRAGVFVRGFASVQSAFRGVCASMHLATGDGSRNKLLTEFDFEGQYGK